MRIVMDNRPFAVYRLAKDVDIEAVIDRLGKGITGKESHHSFWRSLPAPPSDSTPTQIVRHHLTSPSTQSLNQTLLVIADNPDLPAHGLLIINLNFQHTVDALRQKVFFTSDFVPSVNIGNTSWSETLTNATLPLYPRRKFAVFADDGFHPRYLMREVLGKMNGGVGGRRSGTGTVFGEWENLPLPDDDADDDDETGVKRDGVVKWWRENAREREWDERGFVVVTKEAWDFGRVVFMSGKEEEKGDSETLLDAENVGEILVWLYVGFITVDEIKTMHDDGEGIEGHLKKRRTE